MFDEKWVFNNFVLWLFQSGWFSNFSKLHFHGINDCHPNIVDISSALSKEKIENQIRIWIGISSKLVCGNQTKIQITWSKVRLCDKILRSLDNDLFRNSKIMAICMSGISIILWASIDSSKHEANLIPVGSWMREK